MELYSNCCNARPTTEVFYEKGKTLGDCSECKRGAVFLEAYQMDDEEQDGFEEHCKQDNNNECHACATQRHSCEHDGIDDSQDYPEWWNEV